MSNPSNARSIGGVTLLWSRCIGRSWSPNRSEGVINGQDKSIWGVSGRAVVAVDVVEGVVRNRASACAEATEKDQREPDNIRQTTCDPRAAFT